VKAFSKYSSIAAASNDTSLVIAIVVIYTHPIDSGSVGFHYASNLALSRSPIQLLYDALPI